MQNEIVTVRIDYADDKVQEVIIMANKIMTDEQVLLSLGIFANSARIIRRVPVVYGQIISVEDITNDL